LFVCEDNGIGISVRTPSDWISSVYSTQLPYFFADGTDIASVMTESARAASWVRTHRAPAFLHLRTVRLMGHAGSDVESAYRSPSEITADYARDPLLGTAQLLVDHGVLTPSQILDLYAAKRAEVASAASIAVSRPKLTSASEVMSPLRTSTVEQ